MLNELHLNLWERKLLSIACVECKIKMIKPYHSYFMQRLVHSFIPEMSCGSKMENPEEEILNRISAASLKWNFMDLVFCFAKFLLSFSRVFLGGMVW